MVVLTSDSGTMFARPTQDVMNEKLSDYCDSDCFLWLGGRRDVWTGKVLNLISVGMQDFLCCLGMQNWPPCENNCCHPKLEVDQSIWKTSQPVLWLVLMEVRFIKCLAKKCGLTPWISHALPVSQLLDSVELTQHCQCYAFEIRTGNMYNIINSSNLLGMFGYDVHVYCTLPCSQPMTTKYFCNHNIKNNNNNSVIKLHSNIVIKLR